MPPAPLGGGLANGRLCDDDAGEAGTQHCTETLQIRWGLMTRNLTQQTDLAFAKAAWAASDFGGFLSDETAQQDEVFAAWTKHCAHPPTPHGCLTIGIDCGSGT